MYAQIITITRDKTAMKSRQMYDYELASVQSDK